MNSCYCCEFMTQNDCCVVTPFRPLHVQMVFLTIMIDGCKVILGTNGVAFTTSPDYPVAGVVRTVNYQVIQWGLIIIVSTRTHSKLKCSGNDSFEFCYFANGAVFDKGKEKIS